MKRSRRAPAHLGFEKFNPPPKKKGKQTKNSKPRTRPKKVQQDEPHLLTGASCSETFATVCTQYAERPMVGTLAQDGSTYKWTSYAEFWQLVERFSSALIGRFAKGEAIGICAANRLEWLVADWSCVRAGVISIPIHTHRAADAVGLAAVAKSAHLVAVVCEPAQLAAFLALDPPLESIFLLNEGVTKSDGERSTVVQFSSLLTSDSAVVPPRTHSPNAVSTVIWSSGTTGIPKGVVLREATLLEDLADVEADHDASERPPVQLAIYSFAYSLERDTFQTIALYGGQMAMFAHPLHRVFEALELLRPTCILGVPALWNALYQEYTREVAATAMASVEEAQLVVAKRVGMRFGDRLEVVSSGTAPLPPQVREFMWRAFPDKFIGEGYGTQEVGLITLEGVIQKGVTVRLRDVDGYTKKDKPHPRGEICVRTQTMAEGYFGDPERTEQAFVREGPLAGFFCTGDIGELVQGRRRRGRKRQPSRLVVIDRCKSIFKLAGGEYINPAALEAHYSALDCVRQVYVTGSSSQSTIEVVVVPSPEFLKSVDGKDLESSMLSALRARGRWLGLRNREIPRICVVEPQPWAPHNGALTPSAKLARPVLARKYKAALAARREGLQTADILALLPEGAADDDLLSELGVTSLEAFELAERCGLDIEFVLAASTTVANLRAAAVRGGSTLLVETARHIENDLRLEPEAVLPTAGSGAECSGSKTASEKGAFFVTGATGFVGSHLTKELLECHPDVRCCVLVRGPGGRERLEASLREVGCDEIRRVDVVEGDLSLERFGWSESQFVSLARTLRAVFHVGAWVDWLRSYPDLRGANVVGTATAISLALTAQSPLHHISSGAVVVAKQGSSTLARESGYTASKSVAEALVTKVVSKGTIEATMYRIGSVTASSTGFANRDDYPSRYLKTCFELSMAVDSPGLFETIPVDKCAKIIVAIASSAKKRPLVLPISNLASWSYAKLAHTLHHMNKQIRAVDAVTFALAVSRSSCRLRPLSMALQDSSWFAEEEMDQCTETAAALGMKTVAAPLTSDYFVRWARGVGVDI
jgi:fatty acid CoA ligase FadD9